MASQLKSLHEQYAELKGLLVKLGIRINGSITAAACSTVLTRDGMTADVIAAIKQLMSYEALQDWGLEVMYDETESTKMNVISDMHVFTPPSARNRAAVFCGGAGKNGAQYT